MKIDLKDPRLFRMVREFLSVHAPVVRRRSENTIRSYKNALNLYFDFVIETKQKSLAATMSSDFSKTDILAFIEWLQANRGNSVPTVNQRLAHIRLFCNYLMKNDLISVCELSGINEIAPLKDCRKRDFVFLSTDDVKRVLQQPDTSTKEGLRDRFYIALLYDSGCRDQELLDLKIKDFDVSRQDAAELHVIGKGNKYRVTPISADVVSIFSKYCAVYHPDKTPDSYIFYTKRRDKVTQMSDDNVQRFLRKYEAKIREIDADFPHLHAHLFRRSRAMHLYMAGVPLPLVAEWLGHSNMETVQVYARATVDMKRKAAAKLSESDKSVFKWDVAFKYADDEDAIRRLIGLK